MSPNPTPTFDRVDAARQIAEAAHALALAKHDRIEAVRAEHGAMCKLADLQSALAPRLLAPSEDKGLLVIGDDALLIDLDNDDPGQWVTVMPAETLRTGSCRRVSIAIEMSANGDWIAVAFIGGPSRPQFASADGLMAVAALTNLIGVLQVALGDPDMNDSPEAERDITACQSLCVEAIGSIHMNGGTARPQNWTREVAA